MPNAIYKYFNKSEETHTYECKTCGKCFQSTSNLRNHLKAHSDVFAHFLNNKRPKTSPRNSVAKRTRLHDNDNGSEDEQSETLDSAEQVVVEEKEDEATGQLSCRACLTNIDQNQSQSLEWPVIRNLFEDCTWIEIPEPQAAVQHLCLECFAKCNDWHSFKRMCHQNDPQIQWRHPKQSVSERTPEVLGSELSRDGSLVAEENVIKDEPIEEVEDPPLEKSIPEPQYIDPICNSALNEDTVTDIQIDADRYLPECPVCSLNCDDFSKLREHLKEHISGEVSSSLNNLDESHLCPVCRAPFNGATKVLDHLQEAHLTLIPDPLDESTADPSETTKTSLGRPFKCPTCDRGFISMGHLNRHILVHTGEKPHSCPYCQKSFAQGGNLKTHIIQHHTTVNEDVAVKGNPHCPLCLCKFYTFEETRVHIFRRHVMNKEQVSCSLCSDLEPFVDGTGLMDHLFTKHMDCLLSCNNCDYKGAVPSAIYHHFNQVHKLPKKLCAICGEFVLNLSAHRKLHMLSVVSEWICSVCKKSFSSKGYLNVHMRIHTGQRPYKCTECDQRFISTSDRNKHSAIHSTEKPYQCTLCKKGFCRKVEVRTHMVKRHGCPVSTYTAVRGKIRRQ